tara:strand:+ start:197 stop:763 length:567 start_codon:yes stop_codon:yes gene_type:complete
MSKNHLLTEQHIIKLMRDEYRARLSEALQEADVFDDEGNLVVGKDLKVRHKKSQYEYTVDDVLEDPQTGEVQISLRLPDEPRFEPPPQGDEVLVGNKAQKPQVLGEKECPAGVQCSVAGMPVVPDMPKEVGAEPAAARQAEADAQSETEILDEDELVELEPSRDFVTGSPNEIFVIDQEEFEREYEVK